MITTPAIPTRLKFAPKTDLDDELQREVRNHLRNKFGYSNSELTKLSRKSILFFVIWLMSVISLSLVSHQIISLSLYVIVGFANTLLFLNVIHDAAHDALSKSSFLNRFGLNLLNLIGGCSFIWKYRHVVSHHHYPNIPERDMDIKQSSIVRIVPNSKGKFINQFQHLYMPVLYFGYTLYWLLVRDFSDLLFPWKYGHKEFSRFQVFKFFSFKFLYFFIYIGMPYFLTNLTIVEILTGFLAMHVAQGLIAIMALLSAHVSEAAAFPQPVNGRLTESWIEHQIRTTTDFATSSSVVNYLFGGFNFHLAHHLFPGIPNRYYKEITPVIRRVIQNTSYEYKHFGLGEALLSHWRLLKKNAILSTK